MAYLSVADTQVLSIFAVKFLNRGIIPPVTLTLFFWGLLLFIGKWFAVSKEMRKFVNNNSNFHIAYNKNAKSLKQKELLSSIIWQQFESFYTLPRYINWAIPILGFIGTVLGISLATQGT